MSFPDDTLRTLPWRGWFGASDELFTAGWFVQSDRLLTVPVRFSVDSSVTLRYTTPRGDIGWFSRPPVSGAWTEIESEALPWTNSTTTVEAEWTVRETEPTDPVTRPAEGE